MTAPIAARRPVEITQHGETRVDPYAWMKDDNWQEVLRRPEVLRADVRAHLEAEGGYYEAATADLADLRDRLLAEMRGRMKEDDASVPAPDGPWAYYRRFREGGQYPVYARRPRAGGEEAVLLDGDAEAGDGEFFRIAAVTHSPDHALVAYGIDRLGSEYYTIRVRDAVTGQDLPDAIDSSEGVAVWAADGRTFLYVERDAHQRPKRVRRHVLGTDPADDPVVYDEPDDGLFVGVHRSRDGAYLFITSGNRVMAETRFLPANTPDAAPVLVEPRTPDLLYDVVHRGGFFYIRTNADGAVDRKVVRAPVQTPGREHWQDWIAHEPGTYIADVVPFAGHLVRLERRDARPRIVVADDAGDEHEIEVDAEACHLGLLPGYEFDTAILRFTFESPAQPEQTFDYDMATRSRTLRKTQEIPSGHDPDRYAVERLDATASDGARVPVTVLRLRDTPVDGSAPLLLYGYGSYGAYIPDAFSPNILSLVDRGMVFALAHIRGGSARGWQWYLDGRMANKTNTFTDFIAAGQGLVEAGYTAAGRIVSYGGSAGGLLVGAAVNRAPELFAAVLAEVPFVDVLNTMTDGDLPLTPAEWPEWGNPIESAEEYGWLRAYSPYENIRADASYPPILATGGLADFRVTYWEMAKWIARLRDEATGGPFLLRMNMGAGHGGSAARFESLEEKAHLYAFALQVTGLASAAPVVHGAKA